MIFPPPCFTMSMVFLEYKSVTKLPPSNTQSGIYAKEFQNHCVCVKNISDQLYFEVGQWVVLVTVKCLFASLLNSVDATPVVEKILGEKSP